MVAYRTPFEFLHAKNAGADLSDQLHRIVHVDADGDLILCAAGDIPAGVVVEPGAEGQPVTYQFGGIAKIRVGAAAIDAGVRVAAGANGVLVAATNGDNVVGICLETVAAGTIAPVQLYSGATFNTAV